MQQHSVEWWLARCGKVTASRVNDIIARTQRGAWTAARGHYLKEKVAERITGKPRDRKRVRSLDERLDLEPQARAHYEFYNDCIIEPAGFVQHPTIQDAGASPDGLIGADGGIEIKCLDAEQHLELIAGGAFDEGYVDQCHFNLACTGRDWWDLCAFNPEVPEDLKLFTKRIERDNAVIAVMEAEVIAFLEEVDRRVAQVRGSVEGKTPLTVALEDSLASINVH